MEMGGIAIGMRCLCIRSTGFRARIVFIGREFEGGFDLDTFADDTFPLLTTAPLAVIITITTPINLTKVENFTFAGYVSVLDGG
jgi:hypothetical protein